MAPVEVSELPESALPPLVTLLREAVPTPLLLGAPEEVMPARLETPELVLSVPVVLASGDRTPDAASPQPAVEERTAPKVNPTKGPVNLIVPLRL
jgi:hypothetical protein